MKAIFIKINIVKKVKFTKMMDNCCLMEIFLWVEKKAKENFIITENYIKKEFGIMIYFKAM